MPLQIYRLRRILAATAILFTLAVAGMYFYARMKTRNVLKEVPNKIGYDIKQTANGFQFSKSDGKRTLFTVQAGAVKEFKLTGRAELHNVNIVLYGRDSSRYDQIYGDDFAFDQKTGDVTAMGEVQIDLIGNPAGLASPDQSTPKEFKNPIHLKTRDLVFNRDSGNAWTSARVEFRTSQASGWADGVKYAGKSNVLTLASNVHVALNGPYQGVINAESGNITNDPRSIVLEHPRLNRDGETLEAERALFQLDSENQVNRVLATGNVITDIRTGVSKSSTPTRTKTSSTLAAPASELSQEIRGRADEAEILFEGQSLFHTAILKGNVHMEEAGDQPVQGDAGRVILDFGGRNELRKVHALDGAHMMQKASANNSSVNASAKQPQDFDLTAPVIDFTVKQGHVLQNAVTSGPAQIIIAQAQPADIAQATSDASSGVTGTPSAQRTIVTAGKFEANFAPVGGKNTLVNMHGAPNVRIVNSAPAEPDRVSTSDSVTATFLPQGGISAVTQQGSVAYSDEQPPEKRTQAWAASARYTPSDQMLVLTGNPRVANAGMQTTANSVRINRATGEASADGNVKTSYSDLKEQANGALLASSSPIHVTSQHMIARSSAVALYSGNARLWQDANVIEAPSLQFDRDRRTVVADGKPNQPVQTIVGQTGKNSNSGAAPSKGSSPIAITGSRLTYTDSERKIHYEGGVIAKGEDFTASAKTLDAYLLPRSEPSTVQTGPHQGQLDHLTAQGSVVIQQPHRRAEGEKLVYTAADSKFVLTGGPPSIFDAEQGKITGVSLTFFRRDDRVLVEGEASSPVVTTTRVAR